MWWLRIWFRQEWLAGSEEMYVLVFLSISNCIAIRSQYTSGLVDNSGWGPIPTWYLFSSDASFIFANICLNLLQINSFWGTGKVTSWLVSEEHSPFPCHTSEHFSTNQPQSLSDLWSCLWNALFFEFLSRRILKLRKRGVFFSCTKPVVPE